VTPLETIDWRSASARSYSTSGYARRPDRLLDRTDLLRPWARAPRSSGSWARSLEITLGYLQTRRDLQATESVVPGAPAPHADMLLKTESSRVRRSTRGLVFANGDPKTALACADGQGLHGRRRPPGLCRDDPDARGIGFTWELTCTLLQARQDLRDALRLDRSADRPRARRRRILNADPSQRLG